MYHSGTQPITTERLHLRRLETDDAEMVYLNWASDAEVSKFRRWLPHTDINETYKMIQEAISGYEYAGTYRWIICLANGDAIGVIGITIINDYDQKGEIAFTIGKRWQSYGYASEAAKAVINYMFIHTDIERIEAYHSVNIPVSGKVLSKAGMKKEGFAKNKYKSHEGYQNCDLYGIIREEWEKLS
jgi:ribosomal-protein-alanine N-acetyltransferase